MSKIKNLNNKTRDQRIIGIDGICHTLISGHFNVPKIMVNEKNNVRGGG